MEDVHEDGGTSQPWCIYFCGVSIYPSGCEMKEKACKGHTGKALVLVGIINYVQSLQNQVEVLANKQGFICFSSIISMIAMPNSTNMWILFMGSASLSPTV